MSDDLKQNIKTKSTWMRGLYMLLFTIFACIAEVLLFVVIVFQFILKLLTGNTNERLRKLGQGMTTYIYQIFQFLSFNSDDHPYPFGAWPKGEPQAVKKPKAAKADAEETSKQIEKE